MYTGDSEAQEVIDQEVWFHAECAIIREEFVPWDSIVPQSPCLNCDTVGHWYADCPQPNKNKYFLTGKICCKNLSEFNENDDFCDCCRKNLCVNCAFDSDFRVYFSEDELESMRHLDKYRDFADAFCFSCIVDFFLDNAVDCTQDLQNKVFDVLRSIYYEKKKIFLEF